MRLSAKLLLPIVMALLGTLVVHLWVTRMREAAASDLLEVQNHARGQVEDAMRVELALRQQEQEWKNILLRGGRPEDFGRYHRRFLEQETAVTAGLQRLASEARDPTVAVRARALEHEHRQLGLAYREALDTFMTHGAPDAAQVADRQVRGQDHDSVMDLQRLVHDIEKGAAERVDAATWSSRTAEGWLLAFSVALYALIGAALLLLVRRFVSRPAEVAARFARGLASAEDVDLSSVDDDEMGDLLQAMRTLRSQLEEERARAAEASRALLQARSGDRVTTPFGRDLKSPLHAVLGSVQRLRDSVLDQEHLELADAASESAMRLAGLVEELLEASQSSESGDPALPALIDVGGVLEVVVGEAQDLAWAKGIEMDWHAPEPARAVARGALLADLLRDMVQHAIEATEQGKVSVEAWAIERPDHVEVRVDVLHGGTPDGAEAVTARAAALAARMDGEAGAQSRPEGGTHQWFEVHLERASGADETSIMTEVTPVPMTEPRVAPVVAFEATEVGRAILRRCLAPTGLDVRLVDDMETLEGVLELDGYELALVGLDGVGEPRRVIEALRAAADRGGHLTALVAVDLTPQLEDILEAGWDDAIGRPLTPEALSDLVARWMGPLKEQAG